MEAETQLPLKRFPYSRVSSLFRTGRGGKAFRNQKLSPIPMDNGDFYTGNLSTSGRVEPCKVSPEVWLSILGQTSDPSKAWERTAFSK